MEPFDKLVEALRCKRDDCEGCHLAFFDNDEGWMCQYSAKDDDAAAAIEALQAEVDKYKTAWAVERENRLGIEEPKRGKWAVKGQCIFCSVCGEESAYNWWGASKFSNYCPNCGAKMEVQE